MHAVSQITREIALVLIVGLILFVVAYHRIFRKKR